VAYHQNDSENWNPKLARQRTDRKVIMNDKFDDEMAFQRFIEDAMRAALAVMRPGAAYYVWFAAMHSPAVFAALEEAGVPPKQELEWVKNHFTLGRSDYQWMSEPCLYGWKQGAQHYFAPTRAETNVIDDVQNIKKMSKADMRRLLEELLSPEQPSTVLRFDKPLASAEHPTMKPVKLIAHLIRNSSRRGEAVLDLFGGSGTTAIACEQMGRDAYLMELDPAYCDVIIERWERLTGKQATLCK
jgi:DNA modification methylase